MASAANYLSVRVQVGWGDCDPARMDDILILEVRTWVSRTGRTSLGLRHEIARIGRRR